MILQVFSSLNCSMNQWFCYFFKSFINLGWLTENMQVTLSSSTVFKNVFERNMHGMLLYINFFHIFDTNQNIVPQKHTTEFAFWSPSRQKGEMWKEEWKIVITVSSESMCKMRHHWVGQPVNGIGGATPERLPCLFHRHGSSQTLLSERISAQTTYWSSYSGSLAILYMGCLQWQLCYFYGPCCVLAVCSAAAPPQMAKTNPSTVKLS